MPEDTSANGRAPLTQQEGRRPAFGVGTSGRWLVTIAVVSSLAGLFYFGGAVIAAVLSGPNGIGGFALAAGIIGVLAGSWIALALTDMPRTRHHLLVSTAGGTAGLILYLLVINAGLSNWPVISLFFPGGGAAVANAIWARD